MKHLIELVATILVCVSWLAGIVLAKGFWSTAMAVLIAPYAWYLAVEHAMRSVGWVA